MKPIQSIDFGEELSDKERNELFHNFHNHPVFFSFLQFLRDEAYASLALSINTAHGLVDPQTGKPFEGDSKMHLGSFDGLSQCLVKIAANSEKAQELTE